MIMIHILIQNRKKTLDVQEEDLNNLTDPTSSDNGNSALSFLSNEPVYPDYKAFV